MIQYFLGPTDPGFAVRYFEASRAPEHVAAFSIEDLSKSDSWEAFASGTARRGMAPEALIIMLGYRSFPDWLWDAPVPIIGLAPDWNLLWHYYRTVAPLCDIILTDEPGCQRFLSDGIRHARPACLYGCPRSWWQVAVAPVRDIDILFVGNFHPVIQRERLPWLAQIAKLSGKFRVLLASNVPEVNYRDLLRRSKIAMNRSIRGECNMRVFEAVSSGAVLFQEAENREIRKYLIPGCDYVPYGADDLESLLHEYLRDSVLRTTMTRNAHERMFQTSFIDLLDEAVEESIKEVSARQHRLRDKQGQPDRLRQWLQIQSAAFGETAMSGVADSQVSCSVDAYLSGCLALRQGNRTTAKSLFERSASRSPALILPLFALASLLHNSGHTAEAIPHIRIAQRIMDDALTGPQFTPNLPLWYSEYDTLRVEWERAAWGSGGDPDAERSQKVRLLRWFGWILLGRWQQDPVCFYEALAQIPEECSTHEELGRLLLSLGYHEAGRSHLETALKFNPFDYRLAEELQNAYLKSGESVKEHTLGVEQAQLHTAAPGLIPELPWFRHHLMKVPAKPRARGSATDQYVIRWQGDQHPLHSLAIVNRQLCERLINRGHELSLLSDFSGLTPSSTVPLNEILRQRIDAELSRTPDFHVCFRWPPVTEPPEDGRFIWIQPWEFGALPVAWRRPLDLVDDIWVPTTHVARCFLDAGIPKERIFLMPLGPTSTGSTERGSEKAEHKRPFRFLFVGGTIPRKGIDLLLDAYLGTFCATDDVCLVIKDMGVGSFYAGQVSTETIQRLQQSAETPKIEYITRELSSQQLCDLYASCDCLVHPYRAEGFGLPIADALQAGLQVIVTGAGATLDFCNIQNACQIPARQVEFTTRAVGDLPTESTPYWYEPDSVMLRCAMRRVFEQRLFHRSEEGPVSRLGSDYSWDRIVDRIEARMDELATRAVRRTRRQNSRTASDRLNRVSLCMIVRDNEAIIEACLTSVRPWVDELIVVDTGSMDRTPELCRQLGAQVFDFPWCDDFSAARNESLRHATGDWIFWMDSDDQIDPVQGQRLRDLVRSKHAPECLGYVLQVHCPADDGHQATVVDHVKLFRNGRGLQFEHRIHEQILPSIRRAGGSVEFREIHVVHHGSRQTPEQRSRKLERDFRILQQDLREHPDHPFILFNLGMTCDDAGMYAQAIDYLEHCLCVSHPDESHVRKAWSILVNSLRLSGDPQRAIQKATSGLERYPDDVELRFRLAVLLQQTGDAQDAVGQYKQLLNQTEPRRFQSRDNSITGYKLHHNLALAYDQLGMASDAARHWESALSLSPESEAAQIEVARHAFQSGDVERLRQLSVAVATVPDNPRKASIVAMLAMAEGRPAEAEEVLWQAWRTTQNEEHLDELARLMVESGHPGQAVESLRQLLHHRPQCAATHFNLGQALLHSGKRDEARRYLERSLKLRPHHELTGRLLKTLYREDGQS